MLRVKANEAWETKCRVPNVRFVLRMDARGKQKKETSQIERKKEKEAAEQRKCA